MTLLPAQRRQEILRAVRSGTAHVSDLAESFGVSEMTVRRDLGTLARDGKLERVHGGAVDASGEPGFSQIEVERFDIKDRLGAAAAAMVSRRPDGDDRHRHLDAAVRAPPARQEDHGRDHQPRRGRGAAARPGHRARAAGRDRAPQLPLARRRAGRGLAAPDQVRHPVPGHVRRRRRHGRVGHHDGRGPDQAADDRRRRRRSS